MIFKIEFNFLYSFSILLFLLIFFFFSIILESDTVKIVDEDADSKVPEAIVSEDKPKEEKKEEKEEEKKEDEKKEEKKEEKEEEAIVPIVYKWEQG